MSNFLRGMFAVMVIGLAFALAGCPEPGAPPEEPPPPAEPPQPDQPPPQPDQPQ